MSASDTVLFNVGGTCFEIKKDNLLWPPCESNYFRALLSGEHTLKTDKDGAIFLDRDPRVFSIVLQFLRNKSLSIPGNVTVAEVRKEAEYLCLSDILFPTTGEQVLQHTAVHSESIKVRLERATLRTDRQTGDATEYANTPSAEVEVLCHPHRFYRLNNLTIDGKVPTNCVLLAELCTGTHDRGSSFTLFDFRWPYELKSGHSRLPIDLRSVVVFDLEAITVFEDKDERVELVPTLARYANMSSLHSFQFAQTNDYLATLPGDAPSFGETPERMMRMARQVPRAVYSYVAPEQMPLPRLVSVSPAALEQLLDFSSQDVATLQKHTALDFTSTAFAGKSKASLFNQLLASAAALTPSSAEPAAAEQDQEQPKTPAAAYPADVQRFVDYFSGNKLVPNSQPWSHCYGGHQFGSWAGQLGDGRAISLGEYVNKRGERWEVQLKGAGNTPYSRFGDGFAVLRSSIREYLCSEHFYALGVPTSRAAALVTSKEQLVHREELEPGAIVARLAPSWIRFGSFEIFNSRGDLANLLRLADYTATRFFTDQVTANGQYDLLQANVKADKPTAVHNMYARMFAGVVESTARMISKWMAVGWEHGVMNTDNMSILGLTIDFGPYGFLDHYDPAYIVNHSDDMGRYAYQNQPMIALWNLNKLAIAIVELCGLPERPQQARQRMVDESPFANGVAKSATASDDTAAVADDVYEQILKGEFGSEHERKKRLEKGRDAVIEVLSQYEPLYLRYFTQEMIKKLGLKKVEEDDYATLVKPLLDIMKKASVDFTVFFRRLCDYDPTSSASLTDPSPANSLIVEALLTGSVPKESSSAAAAAVESCRKPPAELNVEWVAWLDVYSERLVSAWASAGAEGSYAHDAKVAYMKQHNPKFILRQYIAQEVIDRAQNHDDYEAVNRALAVLMDPFSDVPKGVEAFPLTQAFGNKWWERWAQEPPAWGKGIVCSCSS
ncbi:hypothetical protein RI367_007197 [Sorochytrium milnesiophthora]